MMVHSATGQHVAEHVKQSCAQGNCVLDLASTLQSEICETRCGSEDMSAQVPNVW